VDQSAEIRVVCGWKYMVHLWHRIEFWNRSPESLTVLSVTRTPVLAILGS